ncbi:unnamed protein product, partial [Phaeothamnion confervicola]
RSDAARPRAVTKQLIAATLLGSALDVDHFLAAGSVRLSDASSLQHRPFGHCVAFAAAAALALGSTRAGVMVFSAVLSHQLRDATRRGLWLWPGRSTPPLPYPLYLAALAILPLAVGAALRRTSKR